MRRYRGLMQQLDIVSTKMVAEKDAGPSDVPVHTYAWQSTGPCVFRSSETESMIWFVTKPLSNPQDILQLCLHTETHSTTHGTTDNPQWLERPSISFELVIVEDPESRLLRENKEKQLAWHSHFSSSDDNSTHFGAVFNRSHEIFSFLQEGSVIGVRVSRDLSGLLTADQRIAAESGSIFATVLDTSTRDWSLVLPTSRIPENKACSVYTISSAHALTVSSGSSGNAQSELWFTTPVLEDDIHRLESVQLTTYSKDQGGGWFDICILESPKATQPRIEDERALVWRSHNNNTAGKGFETRKGNIFDKHHEIVDLLEEGNVIGVMVSARFGRNDAQKGYLTVRTANDNSAIKTYVSRDALPWLRTSNLATHLLHGYLEDIKVLGQQGAYPDVFAKTATPVRADEDIGRGQTNEPALRLLSFDGGGVRGISSLRILQAIMKKATGNDDVRPCEYFDMICGTSTGGIIAIMLGRLYMTVPECIEAYTELAEMIFKKKRHLFKMFWYGTYYNEKDFEEAIKQFLIAKGFDPDIRLRNKDPLACKVFVISCPAANVHDATYIRSYDNPRAHDNAANPKIFEAARATSAAPTYFSQQNIGGMMQVDGGLVANNPIIFLIFEAEMVFTSSRPKQCVLSIGTGVQPVITLEDKSFKSLLFGRKWINMVTDTEKAHNHARRYLPIEHCYQRFNVEQQTDEGTLLPIALDDWRGMTALVKLTKEYLDNNTHKVQECAEKVKPPDGFKTRHPRIAAEDLYQSPLLTHWRFRLQEWYRERRPDVDDNFESDVRAQGETGDA